MSETPTRVRDEETGVLYELVCSNCDGRKCMGCVFRDWEHECEDDCPNCCVHDDSASGHATFWLLPTPVCAFCGRVSPDGWERRDDGTYACVPGCVSERQAKETRHGT